MRVLIDACVLYPTVMREVIMGCAKHGLFEPRWSDRLLEEWARAAARLGPEGEAIARGEIARLNADYPRANAPENTDLTRRLWLPDVNDVHVLSVAISGSCDAILTSNAKDFPRNILAEEGLKRVDPDGFVMSLYQENPDTVTKVAEGVLAQAITLSGQDWTMRKLMRKARLPRIGKTIEAALSS